jgi:hypothetical protein
LHEFFQAAQAKNYMQSEHEFTIIQSQDGANGMAKNTTYIFIQ